MKRRILAYLSYVDELLEREDADWDKEIEKHLIQIAFFAHERLVHLIVMALFAIVTVFTILYLNYTCKLEIVALVVSLLILLIPYIAHYYLLENSVQRMYTQYDRMLAKKGEEAFALKEEEEN